MSPVFLSRSLGGISSEGLYRENWVCFALNCLHFCLRMSIIVRELFDKYHKGITFVSWKVYGHDIIINTFAVYKLNA